MSEIQLELSDQARQKFLEFLESEPASEQESLAIRLAVSGGGAEGFQYRLDIVDRNTVEGEHLVVDANGFSILIEAASAPRHDGVRIDFLQRGLRSGFHFDNPNSRWNDPVAAAVQQVIDSEINPGVASHGGSVQLLDVKGDTAYISLGGGCQGCGMADVTLKHGIETTIRDRVPQVARVLDTTDHAAGTNPYFRDRGASPFG